MQFVYFHGKKVKCGDRKGSNSRSRVKVEKNSSCVSWVPWEEDAEGEVEVEED